MAQATPNPCMVRRFDRGDLPLLRFVRRESDGAILAEGYAVRERVQVYRNPDGSLRRELISPKAVQDTAEGIARATLTFHHPEDGWITQDSWEEFAVGDVDGETVVEELEALQPVPGAEEARVAQGGFAKVRVAIRRADAIKAFLSGTTELSPGYQAVVEETPGVHPIFGPYDAVQVGRPVINHLALVPSGRGGGAVRLRADSTDAVQVTAPSPAPEGHAVKKLFTIAGKLNLDVRSDASDADLVDAIAARIDKIHADMGEMEADADEIKKLMSDMGYEDMEALRADMAQMKGLMADMECSDMEQVRKRFADLKSDMESASGERDALQAKVDAYEAEAQQRADAAKLARVEAVAKAHNVKLDNIEGLEAKQRAVVAARVAKLPDEVTIAYLDAALDVIEGQAPDAGNGGSAKHLDNAFPEPNGGKRSDAADDDFYTPHLDHATQHRGARAAGGDL